MMKRMKNGELVIHTHVCAEERRGKVMSADELHEFAVQCLMEDYADANAEVVRLSKTYPSQPDFRFITTGRRGNFSTQSEKEVNVLVVYQEEIDEDISGIDTSWLVEAYRREGIIPRITFASSWCLADEAENGMPAICGADFCFKYYSVSVLPNEENPQLEKVLTPVELAVKYAEAWRQFDATIVEPYLDKDFHYASDWVFDEIPCRAEYMKYFKDKLTGFERNGYEFEISIARNHQSEQVCVLIKDDVLSALVLETKEGRITSAHMQEYNRKFKPFDPANELYMNHGDHLDAIMPAYELMTEHLNRIIQSSRVWKKARTQVTSEDLYEAKTDVISLTYGEGDMKMLTTLAFNEEQNVNTFMSIYPVCKGMPVEVMIDKVIEWDNQVEATVYCSVGEIKFAFFAIDYYCNKRKYKVGSTLTIDIAALAMHVREGQRGFSFEGQQAIDWLAKSGEEPTYDEQGNVKPVRFNLENMVAFLNTDSKCPDEAEFQSPVGPIEATSILGIDFYKTMIIMGRRHTEEGGLEVRVPLYFRQDFFPSVKEGDPLKGWLWVTGSIAGEHEQGVEEPDETDDNRLGEMAHEFDIAIHKLEFKRFYNIMFVLDKLPLIKIREGYELDAFLMGDSCGTRFRPYCCKAGTEEKYTPAEDAIYDDSMYIDGTISFTEAEKVPDYLPYFSVPFTQEGIWQAWLLRNLTGFMPLYGHACYGGKTFVFKPSVLEDMFSPECMGERMRVCDEIFALNFESLLPSVTITGHHATVSYTYWSDWCGLVKATVDVEKVGETVMFGEPELEELVHYKSRIRF